MKKRAVFRKSEKTRKKQKKRVFLKSGVFVVFLKNFLRNIKGIFFLPLILQPKFIRQQGNTAKKHLNPFENRAEKCLFFARRPLGLLEQLSGKRPFFSLFL